jgi:hypothetical protein
MFEVRPGLSYADYVRRELPARALEIFATSADGERPKRPGLSDADLVGYGNRFSEHFYGKRHELRLPDADVFPEAALETIDLARELLEHALSLRAEEGLDRSEIKERLKGFLAARQGAPAVYPFLRQLFHQDHGPHLTTLLAIFPRDYLHAVHTIVAARALEGNGVPADPPRNRAA